MIHQGYIPSAEVLAMTSAKAEAISPAGRKELDVLRGLRDLLVAENEEQDGNRVEEGAQASTQVSFILWGKVGSVPHQAGDDGGVWGIRGEVNSGHYEAHFTRSDAPFFL